MDTPWWGSFQAGLTQDCTTGAAEGQACPSCHGDKAVTKPQSAHQPQGLWAEAPELWTGQKDTSVSLLTEFINPAAPHPLWECACVDPELKDQQNLPEPRTPVCAVSRAPGDPSCLGTPRAWGHLMGHNESRGERLQELSGSSRS